MSLPGRSPARPLRSWIHAGACGSPAGSYSLRSYSGLPLNQQSDPSFRTLSATARTEAAAARAEAAAVREQHARGAHGPAGGAQPANEQVRIVEKVLQE